jgi:hypothetical protein
MVNYEASHFILFPYGQTKKASKLLSNLSPLMA